MGAIDLLKQEAAGGVSYGFPELVLTSGKTKEVEDEVPGVTVGKVLNRKTGEVKVSEIVIPLNFRVKYTGLEMDSEGLPKGKFFSTFDKEDVRLKGRVFKGPEKDIKMVYLYTVVVEGDIETILDMPIPNNTQAPAHWEWSRVLSNFGDPLYGNKFKVYGLKQGKNSHKTWKIDHVGVVDQKIQDKLVEVAQGLEDGVVVGDAQEDQPF